MKHLVFISWWWPYPANNGSKIRIYNLLRHLSHEFQITLLSFSDADDATPEQVAHMHSFCKRVEVVPKPIYNPSALKATLGYFSRWPRSLVDLYSEPMESLVKEVCADGVDGIIASQFQTMRYLEAVPHIPAILEEIEITLFHNQVNDAKGQANRLRAQMTLNKFENSLRQLLAHGIAFTVVSEAEKQNMLRFAPPKADIRVVPNGVDTTANQPDPSIAVDPYRLIYTGAVTYQPNYDAVRYFIMDVLPLIRARNPQAHFFVTGGMGKVDVRDLAAQPGVTFTGYLPSVADVVHASSVMVVPLQSGGGTRLKILEAMALGAPVVSTHKGAEGINVQDGQDIVLADTPEQIATAVQQLFDDPEYRTRIARGGRALVERTYDWGALAKHLIDLVDSMLIESHPLNA